MALFLAGLRSVDGEIVKAAQIDGASTFRIYRKVILPSITPIFLAVAVVQLQAAIKSGTIGLTRALARCFGADNIRVNSTEPGAVITERQKRLWFPDPKQIDAVVERQALHQVLLGEEIARTVLFLASDDSRMITKQSITVDAGLR